MTRALTAAQIEGRACVQCAEESAPLQLFGQWGDQTTEAVECVDRGLCQLRTRRADRIKALDEIGSRRAQKL